MWSGPMQEFSGDTLAESIPAAAAWEAVAAQAAGFLSTEAAQLVVQLELALSASFPRDKVVCLSTCALSP